MRVLNNPSATSSRQSKYRTKLCRHLTSGNCPFGAKCKFFHPAPSTNPSCSAPAPHLFNWNRLLLPQLLDLSNQQEMLKKMLQRPPPPYQGPQLVDEDLSPTASLLLSKSDSAPLGGTPLTKRSIKRKKIPCRHFVRTGGWCPAGEHCRFHHDVAALLSEGIAKTEQAHPFATDAPTGGRTISGGVLMGMQPTVPPIIAQAQSQPPYPTEPDLMQPRSSSRCTYFTPAVKDTRDQSMYWPNYAWQPYQPYYPTGSIPANAPPSVMPCSGYLPLRCQAPSIATSETQTRLPVGSYEVDGTTYFSAPVPPVSAPPPMTYPIPLHPTTCNQAMASIYPYDAPPTLPMGYYDDPTQTMNVTTRTSFDPFGSDPMVPTGLPVIPRLEDYQISPIQDVFPLSRSSTPPLKCDRTWTAPRRWPLVLPEHEFPYHPPKHQQVGHARRISISIKKHGRAHSG